MPHDPQLAERMRRALKRSWPLEALARIASAPYLAVQHPYNRRPVHNSEPIVTTVILGVLLLFVLQTLLPATIRYLLAGPGVGARLKIALGPRDSQPPLSIIGARAERALTNMYEALPVFLALALLLVVRGVNDGLAIQGAWLFLAARVLYVPAYLAGISGVRSVIWVASFAGLVMMAFALMRVTWQ